MGDGIEENTLLEVDWESEKVYVGLYGMALRCASEVVMIVLRNLEIVKSSLARALQSLNNAPFHIEL